MTENIQKQSHQTDGSKDFMVAAMLSLFLGYFGVDRFYLGKIGTGILKLITFGGFGVWCLIDIVLILTGSMRDRNGQKLAGRDKNIKLALIVVGACVVLGIGISIGVSSKSPTYNNANESMKVSSGNATKAEGSKQNDVDKAVSAKSVSEPKKPSVPVEYESALAKAEDYATTMHMSKQGVYDQLVSEYGEEFSAPAAQYAIGHVKADWNANALAKAEDYQNTMHMSPAAIHDQLTSDAGEKFTQAQADYAIAHLNK